MNYFFALSLFGALVFSRASGSTVGDIDPWLLQSSLSLIWASRYAAYRYNIRCPGLVDRAKNLPSFAGLCPDHAGRDPLYESIGELMGNDVNAYLRFALDVTELLKATRTEPKTTIASSDGNGSVDFWFKDEESDKDTLEVVLSRVTARYDIDYDKKKYGFSAFFNYENCTKSRTHGKVYRTLISELKANCADEYEQFSKQFSQETRKLARTEHDAIAHEIEKHRNEARELQKKRAGLEKKLNGIECKPLPEAVATMHPGLQPALGRLKKHCIKMGWPNVRELNQPALLREFEQPYMELMREINNVENPEPAISVKVPNGNGSLRFAKGPKLVHEADGTAKTRSGMHVWSKMADTVKGHLTGPRRTVIALIILLVVMLFMVSATSASA